MKKLASDLLIGLKFDELEIISKSFKHYFHGRLREQSQGPLLYSAAGYKVFLGGTPDLINSTNLLTWLNR